MCFGFAACTSASPAPAQAQDVTPSQTTLVDGTNAKGYAKPGASVALRHDFSGKIDPGQLGEMTVDLVMQPIDGTVSVNYTASKGLNLVSGGDRSSFDVKAEDFKGGASPFESQTLRFQTSENGRFYINAFVDVTRANGQTRGRVLTVPVTVGTGVNLSKPQNLIQQSSGRAIVVMPAEETVIK